MARTTGRKGDVLAAAAALFADRGYAAVSVDEIGDRAGVTGPAIYNHFPSKEALLGALLLDTAEQLAEVAETAIMQRTGDAARDLRALVNATTSLALEHGDAAVIYMREMSRLTTKDRRAVRRADQRLLDATRRLVIELTPGLTDPSFALRGALVNGAVTAVARERSSLPRRALLDLLASASVAVFSAPVTPAAENSKATGASPPWHPPRSRRDEILGIAAALFAERSFHDVSMEDIGAAAGISATAIYRHFANKADIVREAYLRVGAHIVVGAEFALRDASSADDALDGIVHALASTALESGDLLVVVANLLAELGPDDAARERRARAQLLATWAHVIGVARPELGPPRAKALATAGIGAITQAARLPRTMAPRLDELTDLAIALLRSSLT